MAVLLPALGATTPAAGAGDGLDQWAPARVVDDQPGVAGPAALLSTTKGRAGVLHLVDGALWGSAWDARSDDPSAPPVEVQPAPDDGSGGPAAVGPVAVGAGATAFIRPSSGDAAWTQLDPGRSWSEARPFPYSSRFEPDVALTYPHAGIVAVGTGRLGGQVRAAVKRPGERWRLSPALDLEGAKQVRGMWFDDGRPHVLLTRRLAGHREIDTVTLRTGDGAPRWGRAQVFSPGTPGTLVRPERVAVSSNGGAVTVLWQEEQDGVLHQYVRHRDAFEGWAPARSLPLPALWLPVAAAVAFDGVTQLGYVTATTDQGEGPYQLVSRTMSTPDGTLGEEEVLDTFDGDGLSLDVAQGLSGDLLLGWTTGTGDVAEERLFRCLHGSACTAVGSLSGTPEILLALAPDGTGLLAGAGDAVPGCPSGALCTRRLPAPGPG